MSGRVVVKIGVAVAVLTWFAPAAARATSADESGQAVPVTCTTPTPTVPPTMSVSKTTDLDPAGEVVTVSGSGYDECHGIYVAFCVMPPPGQVPTPCGGGIDLSGTSGASHWISSFPPAYGVGLAVPYGPGGSFSVTIAVGPLIVSDIDCRTVQCAVVTRNDHTRTDDRSQDVLVPVLFAAEAPPTTVPPATEPPPPTETQPPQAAPPTVATPAPTTTQASSSTSPAPATLPATSIVESMSAVPTTTTTLPEVSSTSTTSTTSTVDTTPPSSTVTSVPSESGDGGSSTAWILTGVGAIAVGGAGATAWTRSRRAR